MFMRKVSANKNSFHSSIRRTKTREERTQRSNLSQASVERNGKRPTFITHHEEKGNQGYYTFYKVDGELSRRSPTHEHTVVLQGDTQVTLTNNWLRRSTRLKPAWEQRVGQLIGE
ncbi:unnamed protein product, partial [Mesorhabditis belari]|uniref:Uncharacterized protein n=1 Tax=Mesorhabditis belari TaxID=2138241 RepID=A0AAF3EFI8_9BILA